MSYLFLVFSLLVIVLLKFSGDIFYNYYNVINFKVKKRLDKMLRLIYIAPVVVLGIILILIFTYFKSKGYIRMSHAWFVVNFWIYSVLFYYITIALAKIKKIVIAIPIVGMIISLVSAISLTTLPHYESVFYNTNLMIPSLFGVIMLIIAYYTNYKLLAKEKNNC